jgi:hypothetical protein
MPTPLDYERFGLSQDRFARQGGQFDENMDFRRMVDERNFGYRQERDEGNMEWKREQAARADRMALLRMLPQQARMGALAPRAESSPDRRAREYQESMDRSTAHNYAAGPSWEQERQRSEFADQGINFQNYAAQQQMRQMQGLQQRQADVERPMIAALEEQRAREEQELRAKAAMTRTQNVGKLYGQKPGTLYEGLDRKTGKVKIPGKYVSDSNNPGEFIQQPGQEFSLSKHHIDDLDASFGAPVWGDVGETVGGAAASAAMPHVRDNLFGRQPQATQADYGPMQSRMQQVTGSGARPEVLARAMETLAQMGGGSEEDLNDLIAKLSNIDVRQQAALRRIDADKVKKRDEGRQAQQAWRDRPWYETLPTWRGLSPAMSGAPNPF